MPIATSWRPIFHQVIRAFVEGDYRLARTVDSVEPVHAEAASSIAELISGYGDVRLVDLNDETWETSVAIWMETHWEVLVDLRTAEEGRSDLVLDARVTEASVGAISVRIQSVYVP